VGTTVALDIVMRKIPSPSLTGIKTWSSISLPRYDTDSYSSSIYRCSVKINVLIQMSNSLAAWYCMNLKVKMLINKCLPLNTNLSHFDMNHITKTYLIFNIILPSSTQTSK